MDVFKNIAMMIMDHHYERHGTMFHATDVGFFQYRIEGDYLYCDEFYIKPEHRRTLATETQFNTMLSIGRHHGCKTFVAWVDLKSKDPIRVHKRLLKLGAEVYDSFTNPEHHEYRMQL